MIINSWLDLCWIKAILMGETKMLRKTLAVLLASVAISPAMAAVQTWSYSGASLSGTGYGNYIDLSSNGVNLKTSAWSDTNGTSHVATPETIQTAEIRFYNNTLGIVNQDEDAGVPDHSIDSYDANAYGNDYDMVLLEFDSAVSITGFSIGWALEDNSQPYSDVSLVAYTGNNFTGLAGETWSSIVNGGGWTSEENFSNVPNYSTVNYQSAQPTYSQYWLLGAYNSVFGNDGWSTLNDGFKLAGLSTKTKDQTPGNDVPEPGTLVMLMSGLLILAMRRKQAAC
jgi:hypothetical protein